MRNLLGRIFSFWLPNLGLVAALVVLVRFHLAPLAVALLVVSKWQILLGGPAVWLRNLRSSGCELVVAASALTALVLFSNDLGLQIAIAVAYGLWLTIIKPLSGPVWVGLQAAVCQASGLSVVFLLGRTLPELAVITLAWAVAVIAADHFFSAHQEPARAVLVISWGLLVAQLSWLLWRWLIVYSLFNGRVLVPQAALVVTILGYAVGNMYIDHAAKKLRKRRLAEYLLIGFTLLAIILVGTKWDTRL